MCEHDDALRDLIPYIEAGMGTNWHAEYTCPSCNHLLLATMTPIHPGVVLFDDTVTGWRNSFTKVDATTWEHNGMGPTP